LRYGFAYGTIISMIKLQLDELLAKRGRTRNWLREETGIRYATLLKMFNGESKRLNIADLEAICAALECNPGDLFSAPPKPKK
jgi:putative transcriptional regulator